MSFEREVRVAVDKMEGKAERFVRAVNLEIFRDIVESTPVDTGRLAGNWQTTANAPSQGEASRTGKEVALSESRARLRGFGLYWLANNLPYAGVAEFGGWGTGPGATEKTTRDGYSVQAPYGMVRKAMARISSILKRHGSR